MNTSQMGDAIADACHWIRDHNPDLDFLYRTADGRGMFNPATCLNAMHEAEKTLDDKLDRQCYVYACTLMELNNFGKFGLAHATAAQRAEAFLKCLGL